MASTDGVPRDGSTTEHDVVLLTVPAQSAYLAIVRTATAGIAARLPFTLDEIEDLRIAVDEASAMLLGVSGPGSELSCRFEIADGVLTIRVSVPTAGVASLPPRQSFAWRVLTTLAAEVYATTTDELAAIEMVSRGTGKPR